MKIAFFGYAWGPEAQVDGYMREVIQGYVGLGYEVDIFLGNYFSADGAVSGFKSSLSVERLANFIRAQNYVAAVSINNALVLPEIVAALDGRVVSVIVDGFNHLFRYDDADPLAAFRTQARFAPIGSQFERDLIAQVPGVADRMTMMSPATNGMLSPRAQTPPIHAITWIASLPTGPGAENLMGLLTEHPGAHQLVDLWLEAIEETGDLQAVRARHGENLDLLAGHLQLDARSFEMLLQDIVTSRQRVELVERLAPLGLALFGNRAWAKAMVLGAGAFRAFQSGPSVSGHDDLMRIYNSSLISVNLPQSFIMESFQYRLLDIMSSNALLVTKKTPNPDLYRVFGGDLPVPMFDTLGELHDICAHYLNNEAERRAIVETCNALVDESFSFQSRCLDYLKLAGAADRRPSEADRAKAGFRTVPAGEAA